MFYLTQFIHYNKYKTRINRNIILKLVGSTIDKETGGVKMFSVPTTIALLATSNI